MEQVKFVIQKTFKGHNIGTTGVVYDDKERAEKDCKTLMEARYIYGIMNNVRYKVREITV